LTNPWRSLDFRFPVFAMKGLVSMTLDSTILCTLRTQVISSKLSYPERAQPRWSINWICSILGWTHTELSQSPSELTSERAQSRLVTRWVPTAHVQSTVHAQSTVRLQGRSVARQSSPSSKPRIDLVSLSIFRHKPCLSTGSGSLSPGESLSYLFELPRNRMDTQ
jgi:hypothetical protein